MAIIVANGVCRYTVSGMIADRPWANIIDMDIDTTGGTVSRGDAIFDIAGDILNNYVELMLPGLVAEVSFTEISWLDLDQADGTTGSRSTTSEYTLPENGTGLSDFEAGSVAMLYHKNLLGSARNARNGRMYVPGPGTTGTENNMLLPATLTARQADADTFLSNITDASPIPNVTMNMCVVHTPGISELGPGEIYTATNTHVDSLTVDPRLATQRRRLRG